MKNIIASIKANIVFAMIKRVSPARIRHLSKVRGVKGEVMEDSIGYSLCINGFWDSFEITGSEEDIEFTLEIFRRNGFKPRKVRVSWYYGIGLCVNGRPEGWVTSNKL